jgi:hypothetical protein
MTVFVTAAADAGLRANTYPLTGTFYGVLCRSVPLVSVVTYSQLDVTTDLLYANQILTTAATPNGAATEFFVTANPVFPKITANDTFTGMALCRRVGASIAPTDPVYWYASFRVFQTNDVSPPEGLRDDLEVRMPTEFLFSVNPNRFLFPTGAIDTSTAANFRAQVSGIFGLYGTNYKRVGFANPLPSKVNILGGTVTPTGTLANAKDRTSTGLTFATTGARIGLDFSIGNRLVLPNELIVNYSNPTAVARVLNVYAASALVSFTAAQITSGAWTQIGTFTFPATIATDQIQRITLTPWGYVPYVAIEMTGANSFLMLEIDLAGRISSPVDSLL